MVFQNGHVDIFSEARYAALARIHNVLNWLEI
jgi:hypothetical protein